MAFIEPAAFSKVKPRPAASTKIVRYSEVPVKAAESESVPKPKASKPKPKASKPKAVKLKSAKPKAVSRRLRRAVVGGVARTSPEPKKETTEMAKKARKSPRKRRTAAQRAATARLVATNKAKRGSVRKPRKAASKAPRKTRKAVVKKQDVILLKSGGSYVRKSAKRPRPLTAKAHRLTRVVHKRIAAAKGNKNVTFSLNKKGKAGLIFRENPASRAKAVVAGAAGFAFGLVGADVLDRYIATMAQSKNSTAAVGRDAVAAIEAKASGKRLMVQAGGAAVLGIGAYMLRRKSMVGTYLLGGAAVGFAAKGLQMLVKDYIMPKVLPDAQKQRLGYLNAPSMLGAPVYPFADSRRIVGPQATGSVGGCGCSRVPVNPAAYARGERAGCNPWEGAFGETLTPPSVPGVTTPQVPVPSLDTVPPATQVLEPSAPYVPGRSRVPGPYDPSPRKPSDGQPPAGQTTWAQDVPKGNGTNGVKNPYLMYQQPTISGLLTRRRNGVR
jgi:hypothetical protein